nr:MAG TPA: hypothetical protein [Caudoviricetes sp.]
MELVTQETVQRIVVQSGEHPSALKEVVICSKDWQIGISAGEQRI